MPAQPPNDQHSFCTGGSLRTAGAAFMTLEDEMGFVNSVVWESVFKRYSVWLGP